MFSHPFTSSYKNSRSHTLNLVEQCHKHLCMWLANSMALTFRNVRFQWFLYLTLAQQLGHSCCHTVAVILIENCRESWKNMWTPWFLQLSRQTLGEFMCCFSCFTLTLALEVKLADWCQCRRSECTHNKSLSFSVQELYFSNMAI